VSLFAAMTEGGLGLKSVVSPLFHFSDWQAELISLKWVKQQDTSAIAGPLLQKRDNDQP
jgi:hypothetical protein